MTMLMAIKRKRNDYRIATPDIISLHVYEALEMFESYHLLHG